MRTNAVVLCLLLVTALPLPAADVVWNSDWKTAFAEAAELKKLVLVDYYATWCKPCRAMESMTLRDPVVQERLSEFVLLRVNVDRTDKEKEKRVGGLPSYIVYDAAEHEWFRILGYHPQQSFLTMLDAVRRSTPALFEASSLLDRGRDVEAWFVVAHAYNDVRSEDNARSAFRRARAAALESGDAAAAERAEMQFAFTWALQNDPRRALRALQDIKPASPGSENEALHWLLMGRCRELSYDKKNARDSYERVLSIVSKDHFLHEEAAKAMARVK